MVERWQGVCAKIEKNIHFRSLLEMPRCVFSFILPRFFPDLISISDSYWLELSMSRSHRFIFTTSKSGIFSIERIWVACCFGMMLYGKASTFSRFCFWWSFPLVTFPLGMRTDLLFTGRYFKSICWFHPIATCSLCMPNPMNYLFTLQYPNISWNQWELRTPSTSQQILSTLQYQCLWVYWIIDLISL